MENVNLTQELPEIELKGKICYTLPGQVLYMFKSKLQ